VKKVKKHRVADDDVSRSDVGNRFQDFQNFRNMEKVAVSCFQLNYKNVLEIYYRAYNF